MPFWDPLFGTSPDPSYLFQGLWCSGGFHSPGGGPTRQTEEEKVKISETDEDCADFQEDSESDDEDDEFRIGAIIDYLSDTIDKDEENRIPSDSASQELRVGMESLQTQQKSQEAEANEKLNCNLPPLPPLIRIN